MYQRLVSAVAALCIALFCTSITLADEAALRVSSSSVQLDTKFQLPGDNIEFGGGYMYHDGSRHIYTADVHAIGQTVFFNMPTTAGIGTELMYYDEDDLNGAAVGLGGKARVNIPEVPGLSAEGSFYYAPDILAFDDAEDMKHLRLQVNYRIIRSSDVFVGYNWLNTDMKRGSDRSLDSGIFAGMRLFF